MRIKNNLNTWLTAVLISMGLLTMGLGVLAFYGWHSGNLKAIQINPGLIIIPYNAALVFLVYGFALILLSQGNRKFPRYIGSLTFLFGFLSILQFVSGISFGIDHPIIVPKVTSDYILSAKMPVGSAISFCLAGLAMIFMTYYRRLKYPFLTIAIFSSLLLARSAMAGFHYLMGVQMPLVWFHAMAIPSAIGFCFIAVGILSYIYKENPPDLHSIHWLPITSIIAALSITFSFWQAQVTKDQTRISQLVYLNGLNFSHEIKLNVESRIQSLNYLARTLNLHGKPTKYQWAVEAKSFLKEIGDFQAIGWSDTSYEIELVKFANEDNSVLKKVKNGDFLNLIKKAISENKIILTGPKLFTEKDPQFLAVVPILEKRIPQGVIVGFFGQRELLSAIFNPIVKNDFILHLTFDEKKYDTAPDLGPNPTSWTDPIQINVYGNVWNLHLAPTESFLKKNHSYLAEITAFVGGLLSIFLGIIIYFLQSLHRRAKALEHVNEKLEEEIVLRKSAESSFAQQSAQLQLILDAMGDGVMVAEKSGRIILMNPAARKISRANISTVYPDRWDLPMKVFKPDTVTPFQVDEYPLIRALRGEMVDGQEVFLQFEATSENVWISSTTRPIYGQDGVIQGAVSVFRDITELKRSQEKLIIHEKNLADAQHIAHIGSWEWNISTNEVTWSEELYRIYGLPDRSAPISYEFLLNFIHPDDKEFFDDIITIASAQKKPFNFVHRVVRSDGGVRILHARGEVVHDAAGQPIKMIGTEQDITEREKSQEILRLSQDESLKLASIVESSDDAIIGTTLDGTITSWNKGAEKIFGYQAEEIMGLSLVELFPGRNMEKLKGILEKIRNEEDLGHYETVRVRKDGQLIHVSVSTSPIKNRSGEIVGASVVARDISRRIAAEQALRESQELFHSFMNNSPTIAFMKDEAGRYVYFNETFEKVHNQKFENLKGKTDYDWLPDHVASELQKNDRATLESNSILEIVERVPIADGSLRDWLVFKFTIKANINNRFVAGVAIDISERRKAEEAILRANAELELGVLERTKELDIAIQNMHAEIIARKKIEKELARRAEELAVSNQELEQFALVASHDLQEPLRKISSYGELLSNQYKGQLDEKADKFIGYMIDGVHRMQNLIKGLLTYSRVGKAAIHFREVDLNKVLAQTLNDLESSILDAHAEITFENLPVVVANGAQMGQLIQNLISNSLKFRRHDHPHIHIWGEQREEEWVIGVKDDGIGIDQQHLDQIFQIFQRLHSQKDYPGTGIGLAICKKIIERHGGRIWVQSEKGNGTTFFFSIPVKVEHPVPAPINS